MKSLTAAVVLAVSLVATACAGTSGRIYVRTGPPPLRSEVVGRSPGPGFVWTPGFYSWQGGAYVWVGGRYQRAPRRGARWVPGRWERDRRGWFFVQGHWR